jgi:hypothetical protein
MPYTGITESQHTATEGIMTNKTFHDYQDAANAALTELGLPIQFFWGTSKEAMKVIANRFQAQAKAQRDAALKAN